MFQISWGGESKLPKLIKASFVAPKEKYKIKTRAIIFWEEHCVECAIPFCY